MASDEKQTTDETYPKRNALKKMRCFLYVFFLYVVCLYRFIQLVDAKQVA
jgi:hypothetical protein